MNLLFVVGKLKRYRLVKTQDYFVVVYKRVGFVTAEEFLEVLLVLEKLYIYMFFFYFSPEIPVS